MARGKKTQDKGKCPSCGKEDVKPTKTWQLISPLPDAKGRITITVMGSYVCEQCGYHWKGVVSKIKAGGSSVEIEGRKGVKQVGEEDEQDRGFVIEIDADNLGEDDEEE
ncbi:hypothetical protein HS7_19380 [Sulfolobales archaeon HS-7]|nr:hypothetical protein HS7_19380 [Sulfolobales archaeon HS-7]